MSSFDTQDVESRISLDKPEESRQILREEIMDWSDNYIANYQNSPNSSEAKSALSAITELWIKFATFEINLRQFKKAVQVYDEALSDSVVSQSPEIYLAYAEFYKFRGKFSNAQKVFLKALTVPFPIKVTDTLWKEFLVTAQGSGLPHLTIELLYQSVLAQNLPDKVAPPSQELLELDDLQDEDISSSNIAAVEGKSAENVEDFQPSKKLKIEESAVTPINSTIEPTSHNSSSMTSSKSVNIDPERTQQDLSTTSVTVRSDTSTSQSQPTTSNEPPYALPAHIVDTTFKLPVESTTYAPLVAKQMSPPLSSPHLPDLSDMSDCANAEQLLLQHKTKPSLLFCSPDMEPMLSGLKNVTPDLANEIESFLGVPVDLIVETDRRQPQGRVSRVLDLLQGMYFTQALKERHFDQWFASLITVHREQDGELRRKLGEEAKGKSSSEMIGVRAGHQTLAKLRSEHLHLLAEIGFPYSTSTNCNNVNEGDFLKTDFPKLKVLVSALVSLRFGKGSLSISAIANMPSTPLQRAPIEITSPLSRDISLTRGLSSAAANGLAKRKKKRRRELVAGIGSPTVSGMGFPVASFEGQSQGTTSAPFLAMTGSGSQMIMQPLNAETTAPPPKSNALLQKLANMVKNAKKQ